MRRATLHTLLQDHAFTYPGSLWGRASPLSLPSGSVATAPLVPPDPHNRPPDPNRLEPKGHVTVAAASVEPSLLWAVDQRVLG